MSTSTTTTSKPLKPKRGTTAQNNGYTGEAYEVTLDTDKKTLVVHDGLTAGGFPLARADEVAAKDAEQDAAIKQVKSSADEKALSFEVDGLDLVITYGNGTTERVKLPTGKGVGDLWWGHDPKSVPANVQLYSGQLLSRSAYEAHSALVLGGKRTVVSESEWQSYASAHDGMCPYYSSGDGSTTYRMPCIKGVHPKFVAALAEAGQYVEAGLPEIGGSIYNPNTTYQSIFDEAIATGAFGVFYDGYQRDAITNTSSYINNLAGFDFYASRCSSVYRNDIDTVQPPALTFLLGEYVVGSVAVVGEADAESLLAGQTLLDAKVGALENGVGQASDYIIESYRNGTEWYEIYKSGKVRQGGFIPSSPSETTTIITVNFLKEFADTNYSIYGSLRSTNTVSGVSYRGTAIQCENTTDARSVRSFKMAKIFAASKFWVAEGQGA